MSLTCKYQTGHVCFTFGRYFIDSSFYVLRSDIRAPITLIVSLHHAISLQAHLALGKTFYA